MGDVRCAEKQARSTSILIAEMDLPEANDITVGLIYVSAVLTPPHRTSLP